jgi:DNA repair protein RecO (recombination protein O)
VSVSPATYPALVLRTVPYGEADLVVHLFCRGYGKLAAFARGARRSVKRFGGGLEAFALLDAEVSERRGSNLFDFKSATMVEPHLALRTDLNRLAHAGYATEVCRELLHENAPNDPLFDLLLAYLALLGRAGARSLCLRAFELAAVAAAGLAPQLDHCSVCGTELDVSREIAFAPAHGGLTCSSCSTGSCLRIDLATLRTLRALQSGGLPASEQAEDTGLPIEQVTSVMRAFVDRHVRHDLRSLTFLREVGAPL